MMELMQAAERPLISAKIRRAAVKPPKKLRTPAGWCLVKKADKTASPAV